MVANPNYTIEGRELLAETPDLRVQLLILGPGQCVPWHSHSTVADTFICLDGPMLVHQRRPDQVERLAAGERMQVLPKRPHLVQGVGGQGCRFVLIQGVGTYDYISE